MFDRIMVMDTLLFAAFWFAGLIIYGITFHGRR